MNGEQRKIIIDGRKIGFGEPAYLIAEIGINHNGDVNLASLMIEKAAEAGVDAVKFQVYKTERFVSKSSPCFVALKKNELEYDDVRSLAKKAGEMNLAFLATPFDEECADLLDAVGTPAFKIASGDITHLPLIRHVAGFGKPLIISTGAAKLSEVDSVMECLDDTGDVPVALLHCVSHYPTMPTETNLRAIDTMRERFMVPVGYSDHTIGLFAAVIAVARGADIIEKHFTLDKEMEGPDHRSSCDPGELKRLVADAREVEKILGSTKKTPVETDETRTAMRRSITANVKIKKGSIIKKEDVCFKRPATGIPPGEIGELIGRRVLADIPEDDAVTWDMVGD